MAVYVPVYVPLPYPVDGDCDDHVDNACSVSSSLSSRVLRVASTSSMEFESSYESVSEKELEDGDAARRSMLDEELSLWNVESDDER